MTGSRNGMASSPFVDFDRSSWAELGRSVPLPLTLEELDEVRSLGDEVDLDEVREVYLPLSRLLTLHVQECGRLYRAYRTFLGATAARTPFVIGVAGSVSVGKSTTARLLRLLLARWPQHPRVQLVTTDGFLLPNAELAERGLMMRKGFPESYDRRALLRFVTAVKAGRPEVHAPVYSHLVYDIVPDARLTVRRPDILLLEGLNVLAPAIPPRPGHAALAVSDFIDFSVYVDAAERGHPALVRGAVPAAAGDRVPGSGVVLPPLRRARRGRGDRPRRGHLGRHQRAEPGAQHHAHPRPGEPGAAQGTRPQRAHRIRLRKV